MKNVIVIFCEIKKYFLYDKHILASSNDLSKTKTGQVKVQSQL